MVVLNLKTFIVMWRAINLEIRLDNDYFVPNINGNNTNILLLN